MLVLPVINDEISEMMRSVHHVGQHLQHALMDSENVFDAIIMPHVIMQSLKENFKQSQSGEAQAKSFGGDIKSSNSQGHSGQQTKLSDDGNNNKPSESKNSHNENELKSSDGKNSQHYNPQKQSEHGNKKYDNKYTSMGPADLFDALMYSLSENYQPSQSAQPQTSRGCNNSKSNSSESDQLHSGCSNAQPQSSENSNNIKTPSESKNIHHVSPADLYEALMRSMSENYKPSTPAESQKTNECCKAKPSSNESAETINSIPQKSSQDENNIQKQKPFEDKHIGHGCMNPADFLDALNIPHVLLQSLSENFKDFTTSEPQKSNVTNNGQQCSSVADCNCETVESATHQNSNDTKSSPDGNSKSDHDSNIQVSVARPQEPSNNTKSSVDDSNIQQSNLTGINYVTPTLSTTPTKTSEDASVLPPSSEINNIKSSSENNSTKITTNSNNTRTESTIMPVTDNSEYQPFQVSIDVHQFKPEEIMIKLAGDTEITVEGKHEDKEDQHGYISRHFVRRYTIPVGHDVDKIVSKLSSDGFLTITVPKLHKRKSLESFDIPIIQTGLAANNYKEMI